MGIRGLILFIAAIITIIVAIFDGDTESLMQGLGFVLLFLLIPIITRAISKNN